MNLFRGRNHTMKMWKIFQVTEINSCPGFPRVCHRQTSSRGTRENKKITPNQIYSFVLHCSSREFVRIFRHNSFESSVRNREKMDLTFEKFPDAIEMLARFPFFQPAPAFRDVSHVRTERITLVWPDELWARDAPAAFCHRDYGVKSDRWR